MQIVVVILVKLSTAAPAELERHGEGVGEGRSSWGEGGGGAKAPEPTLCMLYLNSWRLGTRESPCGVMQADIAQSATLCTCGFNLKERNDLVCVAATLASFFLGDRNGKFSAAHRVPPDRHSCQLNEGYQVTLYSKQ